MQHTGLTIIIFFSMYKGEVTLDTIEIFGLKVNTLDYPAALRQVKRFIAEGQPRWAVSINPEKIVKAQGDPALKEVLRQGDLCLPDGTGLVWAARFLQGVPLQRVTGIDLMRALLQEAAREGYRVYFLGSRPGVCQQAIDNLVDRHPDLEVAGHCHGFFSPSQEEGIINKIREASPDILLVALGSPRQEYWVTRNRQQLGVPFIMGVGGSLDVEAGLATRAPAWSQKVGLEWFFRLAREPRRLTRLGFLPRFILMVARERLRKKGKQGSYAL